MDVEAASLGGGSWLGARIDWDFGEYADITTSTASWDEATLRLSSTNLFADYTWRKFD